MSIRILAAVAAGGAMGAVARYLVVSLIGKFTSLNFPYGTLAVNVIGSTVLGMLISVFAIVWSPSPEMRALIVVGTLGGFTTFSAFSLDAFYLFERGAYGTAGLYVMLSVAGSLLGVIAGAVGMRTLLA